MNSIFISYDIVSSLRNLGITFISASTGSQKSVLGHGLIVTVLVRARTLTIIEVSDVSKLNSMMMPRSVNNAVMTTAMCFVHQTATLRQESANRASYILYVQPDERSSASNLRSARENKTHKNVSCPQTPPSS